MMEKERVDRGLLPPDQSALDYQRQTAAIFDTLIFNSDRHLGNLLVDPQWKLWCIDHTRSFRTYVHLRQRMAIKGCPQNLWDKLRSVTQDDFKEKLSPFLTKDEIRTLEKRRKKLIKYIEKLIKKQGQEQIILSPPRSLNTALKQ